MNTELQRIHDLIRARRFTEARHALEDYFALHENDPDAWYLQSFIESELAQKIVAVEQALRLDPKHLKARERLAELQADEKSRRRPSAVPLVVIFFLLIVVVALGLIYAYQNNALERFLPRPTVIVPTQLVLPDITAEVAVEPTNTPTDEPTVEPTETNTRTPSPTRTPRPTATEAPSATRAAATATPRSSATPESTDAVTSVAALPTIAPTAGLVTLSPDAFGVPITAPQDLDVGRLRLIDVTRPGDSMIAELGGDAPPAPTGQEWVLIEAILVCEGEDCLLDGGAFHVVDSDGGTYNLDPAFNLPPVFGTIEVAGQLWGYLGFLVPQSASNLRLVVTHGGQDYTFSLEQRLPSASDGSEDGGSGE